MAEMPDRKSTTKRSPRAKGGQVAREVHEAVGSADDRPDNVAQVGNAFRDKPAGAIANVADPTESQIEQLREKLDDKAKSRAHAVAMAVYDAYTGKGGLADTIAKEQEQRGGIAQQIYQLARLAVELAGNRLELARAYFLATCKEAELYMRNQHKDKDGKLPTVQKLVPVWPVYKSNILRGMKGGMDPAQYETEGQFRVAAQKAGVPGRGGGARTVTGPAQGIAVPIGIASDNLKLAVSTFLASCAVLTVAQQDEVAKLLAPVAATVAGWAAAKRSQPQTEGRTPQGAQAA